MIFIWGSRLYGRVDEVPGLFHVATVFGHMWYIPLIPTGSHLVFEKSSKGWMGKKIKLSWKSVLMAWARAGLLVFGLLQTGVGLIALLDGRGRATTTGAITLSIGIAFLVLAALSWHYRPLRRASYERAVSLAQLAGMTEEGLIMLELHFGRLTEDQARAAMEAIAKDKTEMQALEKDIRAAQSPPQIATP